MVAKRTLAGTRRTSKSIPRKQALTQSLPEAVIEQGNAVITEMADHSCLWEANSKESTTDPMYAVHAASCRVCFDEVAQHCATARWEIHAQYLRKSKDVAGDTCTLCDMPTRYLQPVHVQCKGMTKRTCTRSQLRTHLKIPSMSSAIIHIPLFWTEG